MVGTTMREILLDDKKIYITKFELPHDEIYNPPCGYFFFIVINRFMAHPQTTFSPSIIFYLIFFCLNGKVLLSLSLTN